MSQGTDKGPGGLPFFDLAIAARDLKFGQLPFDEACDRLPDVYAFVDAHFEGPDAPSLCVVMDEPSHTLTRSAVVLALAHELTNRGKSVVVVDGDDHLPDLTRWAGRLEEEGWIDVVRYDLSLEAASAPLPVGDGSARLLGVGSYQPTRATADELKRLLDFLGETVDHVIVCASTGDRGAVWAALPSLRVVCWDRVTQLSSNVENMIRDAGLLGESPRAVLVYDVESTKVLIPAWGEAHEEGDPEQKGSSPVFRRMAILMGVLVVVLAVWWVGQTDWNGSDADAELAAATADDVVVVIDSTSSVRDEPAAGSPAETDVPAAGLEDAAMETDPPAEAVDVAAATAQPVTSAAGVTSAAETGAEAADEPVARPATDDPFTAEVGAAGWCLWVYSVADSTTALEEVRRMERRGFRTEMRKVHSKGRDWFRLYTGSFASQSEAQEAMQEIYAPLHTDWALPQRAGVL